MYVQHTINNNRKSLIIILINHQVFFQCQLSVYQCYGQNERKPSNSSSNTEYLVGVESRVDGTKLDVRVGDGSTWGLGLDREWVSGGGGAGSTPDTWLGGGGGGWVAGVEPEHVDCVVVPQRHDQNHTLGHRGAHGREASLVLEGRGVAECCLLGVTERWGDGVAGDAWDLRLGVLDGLAVLHVEALDFGELVVLGQELGHDGEGTRGVDCEAGPVEGFVAHTEGVEVTSIRVAANTEI